MSPTPPEPAPGGGLPLPSSPGWRAPLLACVVFLAILAPYHDLVPFWDSRVYADCVVDAVGKGFDPLAFNCAGHPTALYMMLVGAGQRLAPGSTAALLAVNVLLGFLALFSFHRIALRLIPAGERASSLLPGLATLAFALHPVFLAGAAFLNPDYGVAVFFLAAAASLLEGRLALAVVAGTFAVWSKQPGVVVYTIVASLFALSRLLGSEGPWRTVAASSRRLLWLALPTVSFGLYPVLKKSGLLGAAFYETGGGQGLLASALTVGSHRVLLGYLVLIFVINTSWLPTSIVLAGAAKRLVGGRLPTLHSFRARLVASDVFRDRVVIAGTLLAATVVLTRFQTYLNARYFLPLYPLLLLCALVALQTLTGRREIRIVVMGTVCVLFGLSISRTIDPVSRAIFGTFEFGDHRMLRMTSLTGECCGYGRDQLVYSLEFAQFHYVLEGMLPALTAPSRPPVVVWPGLEWYFVGPLDKKTGRRTLRREGTVRLPMISAIPVARGRIQLERFILLEFPNFAGESPLPYLLPLYQVEKATSFGSSGYRALAIEFARRPGAPGELAATAP